MKKNGMFICPRKRCNFSMRTDGATASRLIEEHIEGHREDDPLGLVTASQKKRNAKHKRR